MKKIGNNSNDSSHCIEKFPSTRWSIVVHAQNDDHEALSRLCQDYWVPIYDYARRQGSSPEDAEDLTQGFFGFLLHSDFIKKADADRGKLRSFLQTSFRNYIRSEWRKENAQKRGGGVEHLVDIDRVSAELHLDSQPLSPEQAFDRSWGRAILEQATKRTREAYQAKGKGETYRVLESRLKESEQMENYKDVPTPWAAPSRRHASPPSNCGNSSAMK